MKILNRKNRKHDMVFNNLQCYSMGNVFKLT